MTFKKGGKKPKKSGRKKGSLNKATIERIAFTKDFQARLEELDFDIPFQAVTLFKDTDSQPYLKFQILQFLTEYTKYKPVNPALIKKTDEELEEEEKEKRQRSAASKMTTEELERIASKNGAGEDEDGET